MDRTTSISDVAASAGVSIGTVSNVLNRPQVVALDTRARVEAAIEALGFVRNESARQLGSGRSRAIGLVVLDLRNPFFTDVARGAQEVTQEQGNAILIADSREDEATERANVELFVQQRVQGLLLAPSGAGEEAAALLVRARIPVVLIDRSSNTDGLCSVTVDDVRGGSLAISHLQELGHRRLAFVGGPSSLMQVTDRKAGAERQLRPDASLLVISTSGLNVMQGRLAAETLLALPDSERPTAIFAANDLVALGVLQACYLNGLRVPQDMALIGYDDIDFAESAAVPLTSIRQPRQELGRAAAKLLFAEIADSGRPGTTARPHEHRSLQFQPSLVVRASTMSR